MGLKLRNCELLSPIEKLFAAMANNVWVFRFALLIASVVPLCFQVMYDDEARRFKLSWCEQDASNVTNAPL